MEKENTINRILQKALEAGYNIDFYAAEAKFAVVDKYGDEQTFVIQMDDDALDYPEYGLYTIIFDQDFAKAFFGTGKMNTGKLLGEDFSVMLVNGRPATLTPEIVNEWEYHLQQMVVSEDPVQYLSKFVK
jgi:hypothetical protein